MQLTKMEFCPKCGSLMTSKKCSKCNYISKEDIKLEMKEKVENKNGVAVVDEKASEVHPITDYECPKCGHKKAYFWLRQMRSGDEPESKFFKCVKCKNTVRED